MKTKFLILIACLVSTSWAFAQGKIDTERMDRDLEIAENALSTLIKQQFDRKSFWVDIKATYTPGFGVTMRVPNDNSSWIFESSRGGNRAVIAPAAVGSYGGGSSGSVVIVDSDDSDRAKSRIDASRDSARTVYYKKLIQASKDFLADYGDLLSQLQPNEKILITNRGEGNRFMYYDKSSKRQLVTIEALKGDISQVRLGKMTREQMLSKITVVNTESTNEIETDLELLSSIIGRLYRSDLSKTFYTDENIYYERLKNFGVIYYMSAYSGVEMDRGPGDATRGRIWRMPTQRLEGLSQEQRDKKVVELFPQFERDLKENIIEYGQTVKSLKEDEMLVFNVTITKCVGCGIPAYLELSIKNSAIRKLAAGQMSKADAIAALSVKKGPDQ